jgi:hypothetical protein
MRKTFSSIKDAAPQGGRHRLALSVLEAVGFGKGREEILSASVPFQVFLGA